MKNHFYLLFLALSISVNAQVAINTDGSLPNNSAMLDVKSTAKGMLIPRMSAAERDAIVSPATGLMIFCIDNNYYYSNKGIPATPNWVIVNSQWLSSGSNIYYTGGNSRYWNYNSGCTFICCKHKFNRDCYHWLFPDRTVQYLQPGL